MKKLALLFLTLLGGITAPAQTPSPTPGDDGADLNITFPDALLVQNGGPVLNVKNPPESGMHAAVGDGTTDDTAAFQDAYDWILKNYQQTGWATRATYVYIPDGTYLVSDTIFYRGPVFKWHGTDDIAHIRVFGQSRGKTIVRLADHAPGFQDKAHPRAVFTFQHPDTVFNNEPGFNAINTLTINTGSGNPGAVGLMFQAANNSDMHNLTILSGDGDGAYGLWFKIGSVQGYYHDLTIQGFDYGIFDAAQGENEAAIENLTVKGQNKAGISLTGGNLTLNNALSDQSAHGVPGFKMDGGGAQGVIINSTFTGGASGNSAIELTKDTGQSLFARNVTTQGYDHAIVRNHQAEVADATVDEYVTPAPVTLAPGQSTHSLNLPIQNTPQVSWYDPAKDWAIVDDYSSVQDALNSGKPVIVFKKAAYQLTGNVHVPASVKVVNFMATQIKGGAFLVDEASTDPVLFEEGGSRIQVLAQRDVIDRCGGGQISNDKGLPVTFYLENMDDCASGDNFCRTGQKIFARSIDVEYHKVPQIVCNGGTFWIFGFKTEDSTTAEPFLVKNGGSLEVLGGYANMCGGSMGPLQSPLITNIDSNVSITCSTNMVNLFAIAIRETRNGATVDEPSAALPNRGGGYRKNFVIPLYVGTTKS